MTTTTIRVEGLSRRYGKSYVVRGVNLAVEAGECVALVGHNGAGKSTLIKMALGLLQPSEGRVELLGADPSGHRGVPFRRRVGFLPENVAFAPAMTGREVLSFYARLKRLPVASVAPLLERFGLAEAAGRRVGTYSKGMRQRLGLAQALLGAPHVLFLDEPTTGLDPESRRMVYAIVSELRDAGATVLLSSHALTEIEAKADRVAVMKRGCLVACGTMAALRRQADLPVRIRVQLAGRSASHGPDVFGANALRWLDDTRFELTCANDDKIETIRVLSALHCLSDIEIMPPTLDDLCVQLTREAAE
jgi:Cu-processing system ATP-binding protein